MDESDRFRKRIERVEKAIHDQRAFLHRIPDPDTRQRGEMHLLELIDMREKLTSEFEQA